MHAFALWQLAILAAVGLVAGFVNTVAGAGSLLMKRPPFHKREKMTMPTAPISPNAAESR